MTCPKCGCERQWVGADPYITLPVEGIKGPRYRKRFSKEWLEWHCTVCSFKWKTDCIDAGKQQNTLPRVVGV